MNIKFCIRYGPEEEIKNSSAAAKFLRERTPVKKARLNYKQDVSHGFRYAYVNSNDAKYWNSRVYTTDNFRWLDKEEIVVEFKKNYQYVGQLYE